MENNIHEIEIQLISYFTGELTDDEKIKIDKWREESSENEELFQGILNGWHP